MPPKKSSNARAPRLTWTREMRVGLCLIITEFKAVAEDKTVLFNKVFAGELTASGVRDGARTKVLNAQWNESKTKEHWRSITAAPTTREEVILREGLRRRIRQAFQSGDEPRASKMTSRKVRVDDLIAVHDRDDILVPHRQPLPTPPSSAARVAPRRASALVPMVPMVPITPTRDPKRQRAAPEDEATDDSDGEYTPSRSKRARIAFTNWGYRKEALPTSLMPTPSTSPKSLIKPSPRKSRPASAKVPILLADGKTIMASKALSQTVGQPLVPIPRHVAKPPLPDLLFRYYVERTPRDHNSERGFTARKYFQFPPSAPPKTLDFKDILNHMDRRPTETPLISCSNKLIWIINLAIKDLQNAGTAGRIALIDPSVLGEQAIFWALPFHNEVASKTALFKNGAFRYPGKYEHLVWGAIPKEAIISTVKVTDLLNLPRSHPELERILRYGVLQGHGSMTNKETLLRRQNVQLDLHAAKGIALLARCMGATAQTPIQVISHIVGDVVRGWGLATQFRSAQSWREIAERSVRVFLEPEQGRWVGAGQIQGLKSSFLNGVRWGVGEYNARHKPEAMVKMQKKARLIGLEFPGKIISDEVDAWKIGLFTHDQQVAKLQRPTKQQRLLQATLEEDDDDDDEEDEDEDNGHEDYDAPEDRRPVAGPSQPRWSFIRQMDLAHDGDELDDDEDILYKIESAASVV
ncbi:hypothetical protein CERZMDRAFT_103032 [Cercospora zeae-maydis SCOH1-5]|uniref:DUF7587 domain-containing protein n=1 Tax=Cercospora zeae-maydis SCOH1-5 TaxID=717836 RepID=A0A6A6F2G9_9PEZI|nr:hypothetical protein CERZMDRAFT_103032 [Cercospora zeae-maydis SCOH1-5]